MAVKHMRMLNYAWETSLYIWLSTLLCGSVFGPCSNVCRWWNGGTWYSRSCMKSHTERADRTQITQPISRAGSGTSQNPRAAEVPVDGAKIRLYIPMKPLGWHRSPKNDNSVIIYSLMSFRICINIQLIFSSFAFNNQRSCWPCKPIKDNMN